MDFSRKAVALLVVIIIIFVVTTLGFVVQTFNIASSNTATIIAGVMGMLGGFIGAMGAYLASINQMEKQFEKQDRDRLVEINLKNFNALLMLSYDYLYDVSLIRSKSVSYIDKEDEGMELKRTLDEKNSYIIKFKKYESMTKSKIDFKELHKKIECMKNKTIDYIDNYHKIWRKIEGISDNGELRVYAKKMMMEHQCERLKATQAAFDSSSKNETDLENLENMKSMFEKSRDDYNKARDYHNKKKNSNIYFDFGKQIRELEVKKEELKNKQQRSLDALEETLENNIQIIEEYIEELLSIK